MPRPRLHWAATALPEKIQPPFEEQSFSACCVPGRVRPGGRGRSDFAAIYP
jgi:hypothetical protein